MVFVSSEVFVSNVVFVGRVVFGSKVVFVESIDIYITILNELTKRLCLNLNRRG